MSLTHNDVHEILKIIDESPYDEIRLEMGDLKLHVVKRGAEGSAPAQRLGSSAFAAEPKTAAPAAAATPAPPRSAPASQAPAALPAETEGLVAVRAPMLGTFYRAPSPGQPPFVEIGDKVKPDDTVCLVEVMKLFNSVKAGISGTVVKILAENGSMVEHAQVLLLIESDEHTPDAGVQ